MKPLKEQLDSYRASHKNKANQYTHLIGIPAMIIGTLILLSWISINIAGYYNITFAWIAIIAAFVYYFRLNTKLAILMTLIFVILNLISHAIAYPTPTVGTFISFLVLFIGGWALQFLGHTFEKNTSSFVKCLHHALIAPLLLVIEGLLALKLSKPFDLESLQSSKDPQTQRKDSTQ